MQVYANPPQGGWKMPLRSLAAPEKTGSAPGPDRKRFFLPCIISKTSFPDDSGVTGHKSPAMCWRKGSYGFYVGVGALLLKNPLFRETP